MFFQFFFLAIIGTERHDSRRVDRQLRGRAGRQGDPGTSQFYVALEDDLMRMFGSERIAKIMDKLGYKEGEVIQHSMITSSIERAQKKVEENNFGIRKRLLEYDDVMNKQRNVVYGKRQHALFGERLALDIDNAFSVVAEGLIATNSLSSVICLNSINAVVSARPVMANPALMAKFLPMTPRPKSKNGMFMTTSITPNFATVNSLINKAIPVAPPSIKSLGIKNPLSPKAAEKIPNEIKIISLTKPFAVILNS